MGRLERFSEPEAAGRFERLARKALSAYGLEEARLRDLRAANHSAFEASTGDPARHYALRILGPDADVEQLERETLWLTALCRDTDLAVPEPMLSLDGQLVRKVAIAGVHGVRPSILLRWVDGSSLDEELAPDRLYDVGRSLATLHTHAETFRWPEELTPPRRNATLMSEVLDEQLLGTHLEEAELDLFRGAIERIAETMACLRDGSEVAGTIHGDLHRRSVLFTEEGDVRLIGFDRCRWGYYAYDLAVVQSWIERREAAQEMLDALDEGYRGVRHLSDEVQRSVPTFAALRSIDRIHATLGQPERTAAVERALAADVETLRGIIESQD
jgi:Ser/Thr protein kinase RdoA (MazF antagonist)